MKVEKMVFEGLYLLQTSVFSDSRGLFQKIFNFDFFEENKINSDFKEFYYTISHKNTIRGMHFQTPPHDHHKLVFVSNGSIKDVVLDLRKGSQTFGKSAEFHLDNKSGHYVFLPKGIAHGFKALEDNTIVNYAQTSCHSKEHDSGVLYNSFGHDWAISDPIISSRDLSFEAFDSFAKGNIF